MSPEHFKALCSEHDDFQVATAQAGVTDARLAHNDEARINAYFGSPVFEQVVIGV